MLKSIKPKIFIRFFPGTSGHFLASVIFSMCTPVDLKNPLSGHEINHMITAGNNMRKYISSPDGSRLTANSDVAEDIKFLQKNCQFDDESSYPFFVLPYHVINPTAYLLSFDNTKLINIKCNSNHFDQYVYNYVIKHKMQFSTTFPGVFLNFKNLYPNKLTNINLENIDENNTRLLAYIYKFGWKYFYKNYQDQSLAHIDNVFNIEWFDLINTNLINKLDSLAEFVGIELLSKRRQNAIDLIIKYADAQQIRPWSLDINDYE